jgi:hypothetical protein
MLIFLTLYFGWQFLSSYNLEYNEEGRYFDEVSEVVYLEQVVLVNGLFVTFSFTLLGVVSWIFKTLKADQ